MIIATHVPDFRAFSKASSFNSYTGLVPDFEQSAERRKNKGISKKGNKLLRKAFVQASQHYTKTDKTGSSLLKQRENLSSSIRAIVERADRRCKKVYYKLLHKNKQINVVKTAVAREMSSFVWEAMMHYYSGEQTDI